MNTKQTDSVALSPSLRRPRPDATRVAAAVVDAAVVDAAVVDAALERQRVLVRRIRLFVAATITYNLIEAAIAVTAGTIASSAALIGFGLDSLVEVTSAAAVAWQFAARDPGTRERTALRIIACSFFALAAYVTVDATRSLLGAGEASPSPAGVVLAAVSLAIMPFLSYGQRRAGSELGSRTAVADSKQTMLCTYLSAVLLVGLGVNALLGWSWADPVVALVIAAVAVKEGRAAWKGNACCTSGAGALHRDHRTVSTTAAEEACTCCAPTDGATGHAGDPLTTVAAPPTRTGRSIPGVDHRASAPAAAATAVAR